MVIGLAYKANYDTRGKFDGDDKRVNGKYFPTTLIIVIFYRNIFAQGQNSLVLNNF